MEGVTELIKYREQVYAEDVDEGTELPVLAKPPFSASQTELFAAVFGNFCPMHVDYNSARRWGGFPAAFSYGAQTAQYIAQLVTDWIGGEGTLKKLSWRVRSVTWVRDGRFEQGDALTIKGRVSKKYVEGKENYVEVDITGERQDGACVATGWALVTLPQRMPQ